MSANKTNNFNEMFVNNSELSQLPNVENIGNFNTQYITSSTGELASDVAGAVLKVVQPMFNRMQSEIEVLREEMKQLKKELKDAPKETVLPDEAFKNLDDFLQFEKNIQEKKEIFDAFVTKELMQVLSQDRTSQYGTRSQHLLEPSMQRNLTHFSLITHGFGSPAIMAVLHAFQTFLNESLNYLEKLYPTNGGGMVSSSHDKGKIETDKK